MALFTGAYANPLNASPHPLMQVALDTVRAALSAGAAPNVDRLAMVVVALTGFEGRNTHPWAGLRTEEQHYSASLLKVAAMYAAFDLRASADQLAVQGGHTTWAAVETALKSTFNPEITAHTPALISGSPLLRAEDKNRKPNYRQVLQLGTGDFTVDFTRTQLDAFDDMIVNAHNPGATTTVHGLGYPYLNGKIADDGFFGGAKGIWLAGDYAGGTQWPAARVASDNDGPSAQATTAFHLARLLTLLFDNHRLVDPAEPPGRLVGPLSSRQMQALMASAGKWFHHDGINPGPAIWPSGGRFQATHGKVGRGPLKNGRTAFSEGLVVRDTLRGLDFVVVWQNVQDTLGANDPPFRRTLQPVAQLIEATISAFVPI